MANSWSGTHETVKQLGKLLRWTHPLLWRKPGNEAVNEVPENSIRRFAARNNSRMLGSIERVDDLRGPERIWGAERAAQRRARAKMRKIITCVMERKVTRAYAGTVDGGK